MIASGDTPSPADSSGPMADPWDYAELVRRVNRDVAADDRLYAAYRQAGTDEYFKSGWRQLVAIAELWRRHSGRPFAGSLAIADYACHYGRLLRWLRAGLPEAALTACDVDEQALAFCAERFDCRRLPVGWEPDTVAAAPTQELVLCLSLITHTDIGFAGALLGLWERMLRPDGILLVTFLGADFIDQWRAGALDHYAPIEPPARDAAIAAFAREGHAFCGFDSGYSSAARYGIGFIREDRLRDLVRARSGLALLAIIRSPGNGFGQDLAVIQRLR
jgi:SAM-dependent methyltransferase